jgi:hypothetical protein
MRASSLYFALGAAHVAICAPVATTLTRQTSQTSQGDAPGPDRHDSVPPHPIHGNILPPHSNRRIPEGRSRETPEIHVIRVPHPAHDEGDILELLGLDATGSRQPGIPCQGMSYSDRNNMLIVFLAVAFFVVVVVMETCGSVFRRYVLPRLSVSKATWFPQEPSGDKLVLTPHRQGVIRLEEPTKPTKPLDTGNATRP